MTARGYLTIILLHIGGLAMHSRLGQNKNSYSRAYALPRMTYGFYHKFSKNDPKVWTTIRTTKMTHEFDTRNQGDLAHSFVCFNWNLKTQTA